MIYFMKDFSSRYNDPIQNILNINYLRSELDEKIKKINNLKKYNIKKNEYYVNKIVRARQIKKLEHELFGV